MGEQTDGLVGASVGRIDSDAGTRPPGLGRLSRLAGRVDAAYGEAAARACRLTV